MKVVNPRNIFSILIIQYFAKNFLRTNMLTSMVTWWQWNKGCQCKKLYMQNKMWQNSDDQLCNKYIYMVGRAKVVLEALRVGLILVYYNI